jgi:hypothetical protein
MTSTKMTKKEVMRRARRRARPGCFIRTLWDDVGAEDGIIVEVEKRLSFPKGRTYLRVFSLNTSTISTVELDQVIKIGNFVGAKNSGL